MLGYFASEIFSSTMLCLCETVICDMRQKKKKKKKKSKPGKKKKKKTSVTSQRPPWALVLLTTEHKGICLRKNASKVLLQMTYI